jgi:hypothetical protein
MKTKFLILIVLLAVACWAPVAMADTITTFNSTLEYADVNLTGPFADLTITVPTGGGDATFSITADNTYEFSNVYLNLTNTDVSVSDIEFSNSSSTIAAGGSQNADGFGDFNYSLNVTPTGLKGAGTTLSFVLSPNSGSFSDASSVLTGNSDGYTDVVHILNSSGTITGFAAEGPPQPVSGAPLPSSALLLGTGLVGLVGLRWRRQG